MSLSLSSLTIPLPTESTEAPSLSDLTTVSLTGTGAFDVLMQAVTLHLENEYKNRRITGKDYSQVYLGAMTAVLQQAVAFMVSRRQIEKYEAEIALLRQKTATELAQTSDTIPAGLAFNDSTSVVGAVGKQKDLYTAQTDGFSRDAEQKLLKILVETWSVRRTTDAGTLVDSNGLNDASIKDMVNEARAGLGMSALP